MEIDSIYNEDCIETMKRMPDNFIDLTVTSPPYDNLRTYNGYCFDFENVAKQLYRVTKECGVVVWVVGDATVDGSETLTSFKQALYFKEVGFNVHDTMIYYSDKPPLTHNRYEQKFEYMFVLSKGKPKTFNPIMIDSIQEGRDKGLGGFREPDNHLRQRNTPHPVNEKKIKGNVWIYATGFGGSTNDKFAFEHPAMFPEKLAADHIRSWSNEGDLVYDCFMGSGTTAKMAMTLNRHYIGSEISEEYCKIIDKRLMPLKTQYRLFDPTPLLPK